MKAPNPSTASPYHPSAGDWDPLSAAVLAGGKSRRMGTDKAILAVGADDRPMLAMVLERLSNVAADVMVVGGDHEHYAQFGARVVPDTYRDVGTLGGIHAAISQGTHEYCFVVACDMPFLNTALLAHMARTPRDFDVLVPMLPGVSRQGGHGVVFQTLHAIYSKQCLPPIERQIASGNRQVVGFFQDVRLRTVGEDEVRAFDPTLRSFFNANTPQLLAEARRMARVEGTSIR
jgi:molybdopterin-guanine dinucleotide biosynthesis protein A